MDTFKTRTSIFHISANGIIYKDVIEGVNVKPEDVDEDQKMLLRLSKGNKAFVIVRATAFHTMTPEAIERLKSHVLHSRYATALVSTSLGVRIFVDTVASLLKDKNFFKMYTNEEDALQWMLLRKKQLNKPRKIRHKGITKTKS